MYLLSVHSSLIRPLSSSIFTSTTVGLVNDCNIIPSETLFVDDGASNIHIGKELGFETFQPKNGEDWREEMTAILEK